MLEENKFSYRALLHGKDAEWYFARGLDDITAAGSYEVRLFHDDMEALGITTADCDKEHYVVAHLFVSESAATGKQQALRVVGQTLLLTICATNAVKAFTRTCETTPKGASWGSWVDLGAASTTDIQDGSITAQKLSRDIRPNAVSPLRPLFIAAGAEYNDTGVDISKTAPWGEKVVHKAGYYYLNGLGDITEEQMMVIYNRGVWNESEFDPFGFGGFNDIRTNIGRVGNNYASLSNNSIACNNKVLEVLNVNTKAVAGTVYLKAVDAFRGANALRAIIGNMELHISSDKVFQGCILLTYVDMVNLGRAVSFTDSPLISKKSILSMIKKSTPLSAITITLHSDAYARLADDADIVATLEGKPLVSLVSA